jgi:hypothetical protein
LAQVIRLPRYDKTSAKTTSRKAGVELKNFQVGSWSLPMLWATDKSMDSTWLIVNDRPELAGSQPALLVRGTRVIVDVLGTGVMKTDARYLMLVQAVGQRVLGIQAAQILAGARFASKRMRSSRLCLAGNGTASALACLVAAALQPSLFRRVSVTWEHGSLVHLIDRATRYEEAPSLFCPDLLTVADIPQMVALLEDVEYVQPGRCVRTERSAM